MQNAHADTRLAPLFVVVQSSFLYSRPAFILRPTQKAGQQQKVQPLLPSLGHGSNTITMVLPGPQGTVQYPIGAPNEHSLHRKIMEKSLALFFYCYQSVVHLQSSLSLTPLPSAPSSLFFCPFYLYVSTPAHSVDLTLCPVFPPCCVWSLICGIQGKEGQLYSSKLHPICSGFPSVLSMSLFSLLCKQSSLSMLKKWCNSHHSQSRKKGSRIMKIIVRFVQVPPF